MKTKTIGTILLATLFCLCSNAASVRLYFIDPFTNERDTNAFYITPIGTNVLSNGGVVTKGVTTKVIPASNGVATNTLAVGHYSVTNRALGSGVVIRVPSSSSLYDYTNILVSGYNTFVTIDNTISGAITNHDTRSVYFDTSISVPTIRPYGDDIEIGHPQNHLNIQNTANQFVFTGGNLIGNGSGLTNVPVSSAAITNNDTRSLTFSSASISGDFQSLGNMYGNATFLTNVNLASMKTQAVTFRSETTANKYDWMTYSNGTLNLPAYNTSETATERGINFWNTNPSPIVASRIVTWADHAGGNQPELMIESTSGIGVKPGALNAGVSANPPFIQLGHNGNTYGGYTFLAYGPAGNGEGISNPGGHSHPLKFELISTNGVGSSVYSTPGIVGVGGGAQTATYGPSGNQYSPAQMIFYTVAPIYNTTSDRYTNYPGIEVFRMATNGLVVAANSTITGNGSGVTNQNYALFQRIWFNNVGQSVMPATTWTNVVFTTNVFSGQNFDSGSAFTLSNSFIIVNAAGAGKWKVRASVPFYDNSSGAGNAMTRVYRYNNTAATLMPGQAIYQTASVVSPSQVSGVITLAQGDIIALQAFGSSSTWEIGKLNYAGFNEYVASATMELERQ
jgi:hypothetical protein